MDISEGLKFPTNDEKWASKLLIGGIFNIIPIVNFISFGYALETMKLVMWNKETLPEWENFGSKFVKGLVGAIIAIIYLIIPLILMAVFIAMRSKVVNLLGMLIVFILIVIFGFMIPMALANYVAKDSFGAAFEFGEIINRIKSVFGEYLICYIVILIIYLIIGVIATVPIIGWIIGAILGFYLQLVYAYYFGKLYIKSSP
ncbi:DUF4013 domain-containing protein [Methanocaldococcus fervens]|uniref:DUF4013 domain-containing protein n=1 Tax=Methanocaldococcus fervens (strain DSM 4213 / JCM 15782 / AG86) TaxID=573064 RepID=C7P6C5_METFA|nr:DUF4013 domain-containing protein [Methanocaldococcus fervens]ACV24107.1 hypothetical protein Mefer_0270 [Methanocaldococcus fervens AG86]